MPESTLTPADPPRLAAALDARDATQPPATLAGADSPAAALDAALITLETAMAHYDARLNVCPPHEDGSKRPGLSTWKQFQDQRVPRSTVENQYRSGRQGIGWLTGGGSGSLEVLEFDDRQTYETFKTAAANIGLAELVERIEAGYVSDTPGGGVHWPYRCTEIAGNTKLARRPKLPAEMKAPNDRVKVLIETRGIGGYIVEAPSGGSVHPTGRPYVLRRGSVQTIATITPQEREDIHALARSFDAMPKQEAAPARETRAARGGARPGDDFNARATWEDVLKGWQVHHREGEVTFWTRPGKDPRLGSSGTTNYKGSGLLYVFSSATPFDPERSYSKFAAHAVLEHGGDYAAAAKALAAQGYGHAHRNGHRPTASLERSLLEFPLTDSGNGELFAVLYGDGLRFDHRRGKWLDWAGHWWQRDDDGLADRRAKDLARERLKLAAEIEDEAARKAWARWGITSESRRGREATLALAEAEPPLADAGDRWDADPWLLGVANGVVDLKTGQLRPGQPEDRVTLHSSVAFDAAAECPRWRLFISEIFGGDPEIVDFVWRAVGYSISGNTSAQVLFLCHGEGSNGKGRLLNTLASALGGYAHNLPFNSLEADRQYAIPTDIADLQGRRFVTASESNEMARLNEARVKALTGEDPITARHLNRDFFTFTPVAKFWLACNHKPRVSDETYGFWRRVRLIPFDVRFAVDHTRQPDCKPDHRHGDPGLAEKLWAEAPGILAWAVQGCLAWQRRGLVAPEVVMARTEEYRAEQNPLGQFLADACLTGPNYQARASSLYRGYTDWARDIGMKDRETLTTTRFGARIAKQFTKKHDRGGTIYLGVGLRAEVTP